MQKIKKIHFILIMFLVLIPALNSCKTLPKETQQTPIQIETQFPSPFDENGQSIVTYNPETDIVTMPLWYWTKIVEFALDVKTNEELRK